mgnify:CR=1 FL=1
MSFILFVFGIIMLAGLIAAINLKRMEKEFEEKKRSEEHRQQLLNFYQMCQKVGLNAIQTGKDLQNATQIASTMQLGDIDVKAFFLEASALIQKEREEKDEEARLRREARLEAIRTKERQKCAELEKFSDCSGREKRLAILRDQYEKASNSAYQMSKASSVLTTPLVSTRDTDWAIHGGIANGLAGPGAGAATAMNIQRQNAENRARADAINSAYVSSLVRSGVLDKASNAEKQYKSEAKKLLALIQDAETALVAEDSPDVCFNRLRFDEATVTVSKTGTCNVMTNAYLKNDFTIFNNIKATVDGTILAEICDGGNVIGCAKLVLPVWGTRKDAIAYLEGMALFCGQPDKKYTVRLKAGNLWAMEAMP